MDQIFPLLKTTTMFCEQKEFTGAAEAFWLLGSYKTYPPYGTFTAKLVCTSIK